MCSEINALYVKWNLALKITGYNGRHAQCLPMNEAFFFSNGDKIFVFLFPTPILSSLFDSK
jgi:hypothetical protein